MDGSHGSDARATHHAVFRTDERFGMHLSDAMVAHAISAIIAGRSRHITNAPELKASIDDGIVFTHVLPGGLERWRLLLDGVWVTLVVKGSLIITVLNDCPASKITRRRPQRDSRRRDFSHDEDAG
jgi:hypothetical protein